MSIGEIYLNQTFKVNAPTSKVRTNATSAVAYNSKVGSDDLEVSDLGRELNVARKAAKQTPDVRQNLVDDIKARFKAGKYEVDTNAIAQKILGEI